MNNRLYQAAMRYCNAGLAVIPLWPDKRKNPKLSRIEPYFHGLPTRAEWARWARLWPDTNLGAITGYWGYIALDFDDEYSYSVWAEGAGFEHYESTWTVQTGRGFHVWFKVIGEPGKSRMFEKETIPGHKVEVLLRAKGGYCIVPPSIHHTGVEYRTWVNCHPEIITVQEIEDGILTGWSLKSEKNVGTTKPLGLAPGVPTIGLSITDLVKPIGQPNARGAYKAFCPLHDDTNPSAWVNPAEGRFGCNACYPGKWFDVVNLYALLEGIPNGEAYKRLVG